MSYKMKYLWWIIFCALVGMSTLGFIIDWLVADIVQDSQDLIDFRHRLITTLAVGAIMIVATTYLVSQYLSGRHTNYHSLVTPNNPPPAITIETLVALCIDDDGKHSTRLDELLNDFGLTTLHASNKADIMQLCQQHTIAISFVNFDMTTMDTLQAATCIRAAQSHTTRLPIIATSKHSGKEHICQVLLADYDDYMVAPLNENKLKIPLQRWLHREDINTVDTDTPSSTQDTNSTTDTTSSTVSYTHLTLPTTPYV